MSTKKEHKQHKEAKSAKAAELKVDELKHALSGIPAACDQSEVLSLMQQYPKLFVLPSSPYLLMLNAVVRDKDTQRQDFIFYANQLLHLLMEQVLDTLPTEAQVVTTPTYTKFNGQALSRNVCGVAILRSGECMEDALRDIIKGCKIGKILIQRDETKQGKPAKLFYSKLPSDITSCHVILLDPMLATGGSCVAAMQVLVDAGVPQQNITFANLISTRSGIDRVFNAFPHVSVVTGFVDSGLNSEKFIVPGIGDFGDRFFGT